jgi:hypothetical protein
MTTENIKQKLFRFSSFIYSGNGENDFQQVSQTDTAALSDSNFEAALSVCE